MSKYLHLAYVLGILLPAVPGCHGTSPGSDDLGGVDGGRADLSAGADLSTARPDLSTPSPDLSTPPVTGSVINTYVTESADVMQPVDLTKTSISALVPQAGGGFTSYPGTGQADGTFSIPNVPGGTYYLQIGTSYVVTSDRTGLDLGHARLGRPDAVAPTKTTNLTLKLTGLNAWQSPDVLELFAANVNTILVNPQGAAPAVGATTLNTTFNFGQAGGYLIDGTKGDRMLGIQLVTRATDSKLTYYAAGRLYSTDAFTMTDGVATALSGAFADVPQAQTFSLSWKRSLFDALKTSVHPKAKVTSTAIDVFAQPGGTAHGVFDSSPDLMVFYGDNQATDLTTTLKYGNPYPAGWPVVGSVVYTFAVSYMLPGTTAVTLQTNLLDTLTQDKFAALPVQPVISPPRAVMVNGKAATDDLTGVTTSPTVAWTAPLTGTADMYQVQIDHLSAQNGKTRLDHVATVYTKDTSVIIPPSLMTAGQTYLLDITAVAAPGSDPLKSPFRQTLDYSYVGALTGMLAP